MLLHLHIVQGRARALLRACIVEGHQRNGVTAQNSARLWMQHCAVRDNALAGIKLAASRPECVLSCCVIASNGVMGFLARDSSMLRAEACDIEGNTPGVAAIHKARVQLLGCHLAHNTAGAGLVAQHRALADVSRSLIEVRASRDARPFALSPTNTRPLAHATSNDEGV